MKHRERHFRFDRGLQTTQPGEDSPAFWFPVFQNVRTTQSGGRRRLGRAYLDKVPTESYSGFYSVGAKGVAVLDEDQWALSSGWTVEAVVALGGVQAGVDYAVCGFDQATNFPFRIYYDCDTNGEATLKAQVYDLSGSDVTVALSAVHDDEDVVAIQLVRDGGTVYLRANGSEEASGSLAYTGTPVPTGGFVVGGDYSLSFLGSIDFVRCQRLVKPDQRSGWMRLLDPRAPSVVADYLGFAANGWVEDRSRYENHAKDDGTITSVSPIVPNPAAVQSISEMRGDDRRQLIAVVAGGYRYEGGI